VLEVTRLSDFGQRLALSGIMDALILTTVMTLSGLLAIGSTRALLGVVLLAITRDARSR
jgi:hypothetical protein